MIPVNHGVVQPAGTVAGEELLGQVAVLRHQTQFLGKVPGGLIYTEARGKAEDVVQGFEEVVSTTCSIVESVGDLYAAGEVKPFGQINCFLILHLSFVIFVLRCIILAQISLCTHKYYVSHVIGNDVFLDLIGLPWLIFSLHVLRLIVFDIGHGLTFVLVLLCLFRIMFMLHHVHQPLVRMDVGQKVVDVHFYVLEARPLGDVVDHHTAVGIPQVLVSDSLVPLLSGCVPDLQFDHTFVYLQRFNFEVHSNSDCVGLEYVVRVPQKHACFSDVCITN